MFITSKENDFLQQNIYRQSWNSARKRWFSQRQMWQFRQRNGITVLLVCNGLMRHREPLLGTLRRPVHRSPLSRSEPQQGVCQPGCHDGYSVELEQWPWEPVLPRRWQCCGHLWWLLWNPYLIHQAYSQEELPKNCSELRDQVKLHDFTQVGVVYWSVCFELAVGKQKAKLDTEHFFGFAPVFQRYLSQSKQQYSIILLQLFLIKTCCS